jgi:CheY-like chemotaxis protein
MQPNARKRPVVLLVEDEFLVRMGTRAAVEMAGFDVLEAGDADEAIAILAERNDVRLIFTDVHMPGSMDGLKLYPFRPGPLAAGQDRRNVRACQDHR